MGMRVIEGAGRYTPATGGEPNHWAEHMASADLSVGTYSIRAGGLDDQEPHREDEIYVVQAGAATLVTDSGTVEVGPGSVIFMGGGTGCRIGEDEAMRYMLLQNYGPTESGCPPMSQWSPADIKAHIE